MLGNITSYVASYMACKFISVLGKMLANIKSSENCRFTKKNVVLCIWPKTGQITHTSKLFIIAHQSSTYHCWVIACPALLSVAHMLKNSSISAALKNNRVPQHSWITTSWNNKAPGWNPRSTTILIAASQQQTKEALTQERDKKVDQDCL